jgi:hypothetical protein
MPRHLCRALRVNVEPDTAELIRSVHRQLDARLAKPVRQASVLRALLAAGLDTVTVAELAELVTEDTVRCGRPRKRKAAQA